MPPSHLDHHGTTGSVVVGETDTHLSQKQRRGSLRHHTARRYNPELVSPLTELHAAFIIVEQSWLPYLEHVPLPPHAGAPFALHPDLLRRPSRVHCSFQAAARLVHAPREQGPELQTDAPLGCALQYLLQRNQRFPVGPLSSLPWNLAFPSRLICPSKVQFEESFGSDFQGSCSDYQGRVCLMHPTPALWGPGAGESYRHRAAARADGLPSHPTVVTLTYH